MNEQEKVGQFRMSDQSSLRASGDGISSRENGVVRIESSGVSATLKKKKNKISLSLSREYRREIKKQDTTVPPY